MAPLDLPLVDVLSRSVGVRLPKRCLLARRGRARFFEDGDVVGGDDQHERRAHPAEAELPVLAERSAGVRVVVEEQGIVRVVAFVERADLQLVLPLALVDGTCSRLFDGPHGVERPARFLMMTIGCVGQQERRCDGHRAGDRGGVV